MVATIGTIVALGGLVLGHGTDPTDESPLRPLLAHGMLVTGGLAAIAIAIAIAIAAVVGSRKR
jgi:hypothetical protein